MEGAVASLNVSGVRVEAHPDGALFLPRSETLIVSDLHLEKGSAYARSGQLLPPYDTRATLQRLAARIAALKPRCVVSLGDTLHDRAALLRMDAADRAHLESLVAGADWIWIEGNHDPEAPLALGGRAAREFLVEALTLRHEPGAGGGEICGHLHPCAKVAARGRAVRARCFATDGARLVMPAYGAYAGGLNVRDEAFAPLFPGGVTALMIGKARVLPAPFARLIPDV